MEKPNEEAGNKGKDRMIADALGENIAITPSDIYNQDFKRVLFGYDPQAVDAFLERTADILERLLGQLRHVREKIDEQRGTIDEYREIEKTLRTALVSSQKFSEDILASAKREAESLIEEARLAKAQAQIAAAKLPRKLVRDIHVLEQQRTRLRREIMAILDTHKSLLDSLVPEEDASPPVGFFDAGADNGIADGDEDTELPVVNIADENDDSDEDSSAGASAVFGIPAAPADETGEGSLQEAQEDFEAREASAHASGVDEADKAGLEPDPPAQDPSEEKAAADDVEPPKEDAAP